MRKKKICFIAQFPPPIHGLSKAVETLYNSELNQEFEFERINITDNKKILKNLNLIRKSKADLFYFTISQTKKGNIRDLIIFKLLSLQKQKCLIHLHGGYYRKLVDNDMPSWQKKMNYKAIKKLDGAVVLSGALKPIFQGLIDDDKIFVVSNCVDDEFLMSDIEFEEKIVVLEHKEILHVLYLSNFIKTKGYPEMLEMAKLEKERVATGGGRRLHFDFAGKFFEESEREFFESYIKKNYIQDFITYHGIVGGQQKKDLLKQCDIFTLLTRYPNEGQPISILEAMGNGMAIITTDHAGIPDLVTNQVNGFSFDKTKLDSREIYQKISNISNDDLVRMSKKNREDTLTKYRQERYIADMSKIFGQI